MPSNGEAPATQAQLKTVHSELKSDIARLDKKIGDVAARLDKKIDGVAARLDKKIDGVAAGLVNTQADVREIKLALETRMATKDDIGRVLNAVDGFASKLETYARESVTIPKTLDEHGKTLRDHEGRLRAVESSAQS